MYVQHASVPEKFYQATGELVAAGGEDSDDIDTITEDLEITEITASVFAADNTIAVQNAYERVSVKIQIVGGGDRQITDGQFVPLRSLAGSGEFPRHVAIKLRARDKMQIDFRHDGNAGSDLRVNLTFGARRVK